MNLEEVQAKLALLREEWKKSPEKRPKLELQARALKAALRIYYKNHPQQPLVDK